MAAFVDFADLKQNVRIEQVAQHLGLKMRERGPQWRGPCPACRSGGERALAVNTDKQSYFCFATRKGGDLIALFSHVKGVGQREAAEEIARLWNRDGDTVTVPRNSSPQPIRAAFDADAYAQRLDPAHSALEALGLAAETLQAFKAGYAATGVHRGKLALPVHHRDGRCAGYFGRALSDEGQQLAFPNQVNPAEFIFNQHRVTEGDVYLVRDPVDVLRAYESGIENVVCFLAPITPQSLEMLAALCDERKVETIELF